MQLISHCYELLCSFYNFISSCFKYIIEKPCTSGYYFEHWKNVHVWTTSGYWRSLGSLLSLQFMTTVNVIHIFLARNFNGCTSCASLFFLGTQRWYSNCMFLGHLSKFIMWLVWSTLVVLTVEIWLEIGCCVCT